MIYAYIAVALVVGLLIGFATLAVVWLAKSVGKSIRSRTLELVSAYDDILEERSRELAMLEDRQRAAQQQPAPQKPRTEKEAQPSSGEGTAARIALLGAVEQISSVQYRDDGAARLYGKIRTGFRFSPRQALERLSHGGAAVQEGPASRLLKELSFETVFSLSTLPAEEQCRLLRETLTREQYALVEEYTARNGGRFGSLEFYDFLREKAGAEPHPPVLRVPPMTKYEGLPSQVRVVEDPAICEGFLLEADNCVFDYCIKTREIG